MLELIHPLNYADVVILGAVLFCMLISMRRGMVVEAISIGSLMAAVFIATQYGEIAAERFIGDRIPGIKLRYYVAMGGLFAGTLFAGSAVNYLVSTFVRTGPLRGADRMLGAIFGFARGILIVCVAITLLGFTNTTGEDWWGKSLLIERLEPLSKLLVEAMPDLMERFNHLTRLR